MRYPEMPSPLPFPTGEQLPLERISPRQTLQTPQDPASLQSLMASIRRYGLMRPVTVRRTSPGRYVIVSGNRRLMACRMLGMACIGARILRDDACWQPADRLLDALLMRRMHYLEEAEALCALNVQYRMPWEALAAALAEDARFLQRQAGLTDMSDELKALLMEEGVPLAIALTLLRLDREEARLRVARAIVRERLCVRDAALLVNAELHSEKWGTNQECKNGVYKMKKHEPDAAVDMPAGRRERRMVRLIRDHRLYLNAIRELAGEMQSAGFPATVDERQIRGQTELIIRVPVRRRRMERYQSM